MQRRSKQEPTSMGISKSLLTAACIAILLAFGTGSADASVPGSFMHSDVNLSTVVNETQLLNTGGGRHELQSTVQGMDVSANQRNVDWQTAYRNGARFAYIKATEGTGYKNPYFTQQYDGSKNAGMLRGAYHFGRPDISNGASQARYFVQNGGRWSRDGKTLPGALDIEYNPTCGSSCTAAQKCYNLGQAQLGTWIKDFITTYRQATGVYPVIYSTADWYNTCVGTRGDFSANCHFWIACYCPRITTYPYKWRNYTFWQYADRGTFPGDQDLFNGPFSQLQALARNG